jgi:hypothetical protein
VGVTAVGVAVTAFEMLIVVPEGAGVAMYVLAGMPVPVMGCPTASPAMLDIPVMTLLVLMTTPVGVLLVAVVIAVITAPAGIKPGAVMISPTTAVVEVSTAVTMLVPLVPIWKELWYSVP